MITKEQLIDLLAKEAKILKHLYTKILPGTLNYKPTEKQRTTEELLKFLSFGLLGSVKFVMDPKTGEKAWAELEEKSKSMKAEDFQSAIDAQLEEVKKITTSLTEPQLNEVIELWGNSGPRSLFLVSFVLESAVAYRMQLFLYIKASGNTSINTWNLWSGEDGKM